MNVMNAWIRKGLVVGFVAFLGTIVVLANRSALPPLLSFYKQVPLGDKLGHFILMGVFSFLMNLALNARSFQWGKVQLLQGTVWVAAIVTLEELSQFFFPSRSLSWTDLLSDYLGIFCFGQLASGVVKLIDNGKARSVDRQP